MPVPAKPIPPLTPEGERLVADYLRLSYRLATDAIRRRGIARGHYEADDVYSLANWCLLECAAKWDGRKNFPDFLADRFWQRLVGETRAKRSRLRAAGGLDADAVPDPGDDWLDGPAAVAAFEARVAALAPPQRDLLRLVFVEGLSVVDAAERLGATRKRANLDKHHAYAKLRHRTPPGRRP